MKREIETVRTIVILILLAAALAVGGWKSAVWTMATVSADQPIGMEATPRPTLTPPVITPEPYPGPYPAPPTPLGYPAPDAYPVYLPRIDRAALEGYP